jgi:hypothetical protein
MKIPPEQKQYLKEKNRHNTAKIREKSNAHLIPTSKRTYRHRYREKKNISCLDMAVSK